MGLLDGILDAVGIGTGGVPWGTIASGVFGLMGQEQANESNQYIAQQASAFNADEANKNRAFQSEQAGIARDWTIQQAQKQMDFQERMSNSAYQRATSDMKAAGLNPMLAYQQGGASSPPGAQGSTSVPSGGQGSAVTIPVGNRLAAGLSAAQQAASVENTQAQTERTRAEVDQVDANTRRLYAEEVRVAKETGRIQALTDQIRQEMTSFEKRMERLGYETDLAHSRATVGLADARIAMHRYNFAGDLAKGERDKLQNEARRLLIMGELLDLEIPGAVNAAAHQTKYRDYNIDVRPFYDDVGKITHSAREALEGGIRAFRGFKLK